MKKPLSRQRLIASLGGVFIAGLLILYMTLGTNTPQQHLEKRLESLSQQEANLVSLSVEAADSIIQAGQEILQDAPAEEKESFLALQKAKDAFLQAMATADLKQHSLSPAERRALKQLTLALDHFTIKEFIDEPVDDAP